MGKEQPITIDANTARRMALNAKMNPRQTIYVEATQTINPITGRPYEDQFISECERRRIKNNRWLREWNAKVYVNSLLSLLSETSPAIELQKALGRMEVRDGRLHEVLYDQFLENLDKLTEIYAQNPDLTLESITDVNGLNAGLRAIGSGEFPIGIEKRKTSIENYYTKTPRNILPFEELDISYLFNDTLNTKRKPEDRELNIKRKPENRELNIHYLFEKPENGPN